MKPCSPDARADRRLAISLALIAGYVDAYGIVVFSTYVSFMSGNTTQAGVTIGQGDLLVALSSGLAIVFFVTGSCAATCLACSRPRHSRQLLFGVVAALLGTNIGLTQTGWMNTCAGIATLSLSMGLMNNMLSRVGAEAVSLTFVTGTLNRLGSHLALAINQAVPDDAQGPWDTHLRRAALLALIWTGFLTGAVLCGATIRYCGVWVLLLPGLILLALALFWRDNCAFGNASP
jgi:uncharacterized membrane protein YoaK (UPF0700 family)